MAAAHAMRFRFRVRRASKIAIFEHNAHSVPPKIPVYSYHCTAQKSVEKPCPKSNHGKVITSAELYAHSVANHTVTRSVYAKARLARFEV